MTAPGQSSDPLDTKICRRFQSAWWNRQAQAIEYYLPAEDHPDYLATLEQLVLLELELAYQFGVPPAARGAVMDSSPDASDTVGKPPRVEAYLARFPRLNQPAIVQRLMGQEYLVRQRHGESPSPEEFQERFPAFVEPGETLSSGRPAVAELPQIPGYAVLRVLGIGGMGVVYLARQVNLDRLVALKMMTSRAADAEELTRFRTEAEALAHVTHPHIIQIYEIGHCDGGPYVALEYAAGGNLAQALAGRALPARLAARLAETLARTMHHAHQRGIVHRDLKPANILLTGDEASADSSTDIAVLIERCTLKITDFGLAKRLAVEAGATSSGVTRTGIILGTPAYMAPEQAQGLAKRIGPAADVYALGVILYECLAGRPPFKAATPFETLRQVMEQEPPPVRQWQPQVPRDLQTICLNCLRKEPGQRYSSAAALADDLACFLAGMPIRARPAGRAERLWRWCRRNPAPAGVTAVAATTVVLLAVLLGLQLRHGLVGVADPPSVGGDDAVQDGPPDLRKTGPVRVTNNTTVQVQYRYSLDNGATWTERILDPGHFVEVTPTTHPVRVAYWAGPDWLDYHITGVPNRTAFYQFEPIPTGGVILRGAK